MQKQTIPIAEELAKRQREISVAEFFERNKQILGFDSLTRAMLTSVKEAVDNSLDACEEADILPELIVGIKKEQGDEYYISIEDNGPGIVEKQIPNIFGKLLYGSRFHAIRQSRGQQGIGISAVVLYSQLTTGKPSKITSKILEDRPATYFELILDTKKNHPEIIKKEIIHWEKKQGTKFECYIKGKYIKGKQSVYEYLRSTAIVNPHARIIFIEIDGNKTIFERATDKMPIPTKEIKPHPEGTELGILLKMAKATSSYTLTGFLSTEFSRISLDKAKEICAIAGIEEEQKPKKLELESARKIIESFKKVRFMSPPTDCLSPIGEILIKKGLKKDIKSADFIITNTRSPSVYSGNPFQVEVGLVYGGELNKEEQIQILRFANRVPLLYQQGGCVITQAIEEVDWRRYGLEQKGGKGIPFGACILLVHVASTKIPFTSESKEAIANIDEIKNEIILALQECGRKMLTHIKKKERLNKMKEKEEIIRKILPLIAEKSAKIVGKKTLNIEQIIAKIMNSVIISDKIDFNEKERKHSVKIEVVNYTPTSKSFKLLVSIPKDARLDNIAPRGVFEDNILTWEIKIKANERNYYFFELVGLDKEDYDENELYIKDIDIELVSGAEPFDLSAYMEKKREEEVKEEELEEDD